MELREQLMLGSSSVAKKTNKTIISVKETEPLPSQSVYDTLKKYEKDDYCI